MNRSQKIIVGFVSLLISAFIIGFLYLFCLQTNPIPKRELVFYFVFLGLLFSILIYFLLTRFLVPRFHEYSPHAQRNWILITIAVGVLFALVTRPPQLRLLLPKHSFQIIVPSGTKDRTITLERASSILSSDISFSQFYTTGNWKQTDSGFTYSGSNEALLSWSSRTGDSATLEFSPTSGLEDVQVTWDGTPIPIDLSSTSNTKISLLHKFPIPWFSSIVSRLIVGFTFAFLFLIITLFLAGIELKPTRKVVHKKGYWLLYTLPMITVWGIYLLAFFPGMMSGDSNVQWNQFVTGNYTDAHPILSTLYLWLLSRIWYSPAAIAIFQIIILSLIFAWGISLLDEKRLPPWAAWLLAGIFALFPLSGDMVINLWKDTIYSTSLLFFSLIVLKIIFSNGEWLSRKATWVWIGLVSFSVISFRHNGIPVPFLTIIVLLIFYKKWWKSLVYSLGLIVGLSLLVQGPLYSSLHVERSGVNESMPVHHIAAHIVTGGPLTLAEEKIANEITLINEWQYDCCSHLPTTRAPSHSHEKNGVLAPEINKLALELALKEPGVELQHTVCISSLVWEIPNRCGINNFMPSGKSSESIRWISPYKDAIFKEDSIFTWTKNLLSSQLIFMQFNSIASIFLSPAIYLYISIYFVCFFVFRTKQIRTLIFLVPAGFHTVLIGLTNIASNFRYQYGIMLLCIFTIGLLILAFSTPKKNQYGLVPVPKKMIEST